MRVSIGDARISRNELDDKYETSTRRGSRSYSQSYHRASRRKFAVLLGAAFIILLWHFTIVPSNASEFVEKEHDEHEVILALYDQYHRYASLENTTVRAYAYDEIDAMGLFVRFLRDKSLEDRCAAFFDYSSNVAPVREFSPLHYDKGAFKSLASFKANLIAEAEKADELIPLPLDEVIEAHYRLTLQSFFQQVESMHSYLSQVRAFDKCFLGKVGHGSYNSDRAVIEKQRKRLDMVLNGGDASLAHDGVPFESHSCHQIEIKQFPWLLHEFPKTLRYDEKIGTRRKTWSTNSPDKCFLQEMKASLESKGISMYVSDTDILELLRSVRVMRALNNRLPIQIVHTSALSEKSKSQLVEIARGGLNKNKPQHITFVDISDSVDEMYIDLFEQNDGLLAASIFNTFEEVLVLHPKTVLMAEPNDFFESRKYKQSGSLFFESLRPKPEVTSQEVEYLKMLYPSVEDTIVFNQAQVPDTLLTRNDSETKMINMRLFVLDHKRHFTKLLAMINMEIYNPVIKEVFGSDSTMRLAFSSSGDDALEIERDTLVFTGSDALSGWNGKAKFCSTHQTYTSGSHTQSMLWSDLGFKYCDEYVNYESELAQNGLLGFFKTKEDLMSLFEGKENLTHIVRPKETILSSGWSFEETTYCNQRMWCIMKSEGTVESPFEITESLTPSAKNQLDMIGNAWADIAEVL